MPLQKEDILKLVKINQQKQTTPNKNNLNNRL